ncbi:MAG: bifunctional pyr operon transcriptional regulator/uracil phosphoribosyltransferase PyrR [bacterium]
MHNAKTIAAMIERMADGIEAQRLDAPVLVGIRTGGAWLAERLAAALAARAGGAAPQLGALDISFYRDDFSRVGLNPEVKASELPMAVDGRDIVLVDDVLHTGRTIRAALNEIFAYGRPERIRLAVLIDRPGRELPIHADVVGESLDLSQHEEAKLSNTDGRLALDIIRIGEAAR